MAKDIIIGIDPSLNSTGICVKNDQKYKYYNITTKKTKKMEEFSSNYINLCFVDKPNMTDLSYSEKEYQKSHNIYHILEHIKQILKKHKPIHVIMEGLSYGSNGQLGDLGGLNYVIRMILIQLNIPFTIVPPTSWKKQLLGNAGADKDIIVETWKKLDKNIKNTQSIKLDDLADAYFLSNYKFD